MNGDIQATVTGGTSLFNRKWAAAKETMRRILEPRYWLYRLRWHSAGKKFLGWRYIPSVPLHLDIELSYACNFKCVMCPQSYDENPKGIMTTDLAASLIEQAAHMGVASIKWNWRGEATLHKDIVALTSYAKVLGIPEVQLNTNGNMRGCSVIGLVNSGIDRIIFSVDGNTKETFESIRLGGDWDELVATIHEAKSYRDLKGLRKPFIRVQMCKQKANAHETRGFIERWKGIADDIRVSMVVDRGAGGEPLIDDMVIVGRNQCPQPSQRLTIGYDGKVFPCCGSWFEERPVGDATKQTLRHIWEESQALWDVRTAQWEGRQTQIAPCKTCFVKDGYLWEQKKDTSRHNSLRILP